MKLDEYTINARIYPSLICAIPALVLVATFGDDTLKVMIEEIAAVEVFGRISVSLAVFVFLMHVSRFLGKDIFERKLFKNELHFPTTTLLLASDDSLSPEFKMLIANKVKSEFDLALPSLDDERSEESNARVRIRDIVARIRASTGNAALVLQRNWEYGFVRNLVGGSTISVFFSGLGVASNLGNPLAVFFLCSTVFYASILIVGPWLIRKYASHYAKQLLYAFVGDNR